MGLSPRTVETDRYAGSLYRIDPDGTVTSQVTKVDISNGIAWTPDNKTMYYIDSLPRKVYAFDFDLKTGKIGMVSFCNKHYTMCQFETIQLYLS